MRTAFESVTERMLYVFSEVHSTASSSGLPLIVRLSHMSETIEQHDCAN